MLIGCKTIITTLTPNTEIETLHVGKKMLSMDGIFGWSPTTIKREYSPVKGSRDKIWYVSHTGGGYPLDLTPAEDGIIRPAVSVENTYTLIVYLDKNYVYIPKRVYAAIDLMLAHEKKDVYLVKSSPFTLSQSPIWQEVYLLTADITLKEYTFVSFENVENSNSVQVLLHTEPMNITPMEGW